MMRHVLQCCKFFDQLLEMDREIAAAVQQEGCSHCGGRLHVANYWRKPRGVPAGLAHRWCLRLSLCCAREGCRRRRTPPSVRFFGGRVFAAALFVLAGLLASASRPSPGFGWTEARRRLGIARRTWSRWLQWWRRDFPRSEVGRELRGRWMEASTPLGLYRHLPGAPPGRMRELLAILAAAPRSHSIRSRCVRGI